jgi:hypothetical protein
MPEGYEKLYDGFAASFLLHPKSRSSEAINRVIGSFIGFGLGLMQIYL